MAAAPPEAPPASLRIASLLPSLTEIVCALGLSSHLVGVTHECDHPPADVARVPVVTSTHIPHGLSQGDIHAAVQGSLSAAQSLYALNEDALRAAAPTLVLTQALCDVCAVAHSAVLATCARVLSPGGDGDGGADGAPVAPSPSPRVVSLEPTDLSQVWATMRVLGAECGVPSSGHALARRCARGVAAVTAAVDAHVAETGACRPRVAFLEWCDPLFSGGHWVPGMIAAAGGTYSLGAPGERSAIMTPEALVAAAPDFIFVAPCGFDERRAAADAAPLFRQAWFAGLPAVRAGRVFALDANSYYARPGPRLVQGTALLAQLMHGHGVDAGLAPGPEAWLRCEAPPAEAV
jgi:iron complex transport system substrate-binding protein